MEVPDSPAQTVEPESHDKLKKEKKEKKEKKDKSAKKSKKDKKAKKDKKDKKSKRSAPTEEDQESDVDSDIAEAKRQKSQPGTPSEKLTEDEAASDPPSSTGEPEPAVAGDNGQKLDTDKKQKENRMALAALQRASTADLALDLQDSKSDTSDAKPSLSEVEGAESEAGSTMELTDQQRIARHNHLNRYYRSLKGLGPSNFAFNMALGMNLPPH